MILLAFSVVTAGVLIPHSPSFVTFPARDPGIFLYIGDQILHGSIPYRDVWDHKPPVIYYLNALGLWLGGGSVWGVWWLELVSLFVAATFGYLLLERAETPNVGALASLMWLMQAGVLLAFEDGNYPEEFVLPLQFVALYLWSRAARHGPNYWGWYVIGLTGAVAFLLKQNAIGIWIAISLHALVSARFTPDLRILRRQALAMSLGTLTVLLVVCSYLQSHQALHPFWDAAFRYNLSYIGTRSGLQTRIEGVLVGLGLMALSGLLLLAFPVWVSGTAPLLRSRGRSQRAGQLLNLCLLSFPIELILSGVSGRHSPHYYFAWLPTFTVLASTALHSLMGSANYRIGTRLRLSSESVRTVGLAAVVMLMGVLSIGVISYARSKPDGNQQTRVGVAGYIRSHTNEGDYVLMWGAEPGINFVTRRPSPTRYIYQDALYMPNYKDASLAEEFLQDLGTNPPVLIVDAATVIHAPPLDPVERTEWTKRWGSEYAPEPMQDVYAYVASNYTLVDIVGPARWKVYRRSGAPKARTSRQSVATWSDIITQRRTEQSPG